MKCVKGYDLKVMRNGAGVHYIGTSDEYGLPNCRVSDYYKTSELANNDLESMNFKERDAIENEFCRGNCSSCIKRS